MFFLKLTITLLVAGMVLYVGGVATLPIHDPIFGSGKSWLKTAGARVIQTGAALVGVAVVFGAGLLIYSIWAAA